MRGRESESPFGFQTTKYLWILVLLDSRSSPEV
jgi:hypothetical protein